MSKRNPDQELKKFKQHFEKAARQKDRAALEKMIHDDFTLVTPEGAVVQKNELINDIVDPTSNFMDSFFRTERKTVFHVDGNTARETADVKLKGRVGKRPQVDGDYVNTATYVRGSAGWQMAGNSLTKK